MAYALSVPAYSDDDWDGIDITPSNRQTSRIYRPRSNSDLESGSTALRVESPRKNIFMRIRGTCADLVGTDNSWKAWLTIFAIVIAAVLIYAFVVLLIVTSL